MAGQKLVPYVHSDGKTWEYFFADPVTGIIYFSKSHNGKKIKFSTKETNGPRAKIVANKEFDRRTGKTQLRVRSTIGEELKAWLLLKEGEGHAYDTMNNVRRAARQIEEYWGDMLPNEINRDTLSEWYAWWKVNHADIEMTNAVKYMRNFARYLHEKVINDRPLLPAVPQIRDPNRKAILAKRAKKKERVFSLSDFRTLCQTASSDEEALMAMFMYTMGTRVDETLKLEFGVSIRLDDEIPVYRWTVGSNKQDLIGEHALHDALIEPLERLRKIRKGEGTTLLFPQKFNNQKALSSQQVDWDGWRKRAGIDFHWTPHTFRHTCLTNLFNDHRNPHAVICKQYRVSLDVALETYVKVTRESMLAIRNAIDASLGLVRIGKAQP